MGARVLFLRAALWLAALVGFALAGPASARALGLDAVTCVGGASSAEAAFAISPASLDCGPKRFVKRDRFLRAHSDLNQLGALPTGQLVWQTDPASFDSMLIRLDYADGSRRLIDVDAQMGVRNWDADGNFWVSIPQQGTRLSAIDVVVERPRSSTTLARMTITDTQDAASLDHSRTLIYILICGTLLVPIMYDLLFYWVLRARFMLCHLGMAIGTLAYVKLNSGLVFLLFPSMPLGLRFGAVFVSASFIIMCTARFSLLLMEEGRVPERLRMALTLTALANFGFALLVAADLDILRMWIVSAYVLSVIPVMIAVVATLAVALMRHSRAAIFLAVAYTGLIATGLLQILSSLGIIDSSPLLDDAVYVALVLLVVGTSAGVGDRFLIIKAERDRALLAAIKLGTMANSDGLTGLLNRRAFDQHRRLSAGHILLVADIDRFKLINDTYGHQRGDAVLCEAARVIEAAVSMREGAQVFRLGGEEFAVLCRASGVKEMTAIADTIRRAIATREQRRRSEDLPPITISVGGVLGRGQLMHVAFSEADGALYRAKTNGRDRVEIAQPDEAVSA